MYGRMGYIESNKLNQRNNVNMVFIGMGLVDFPLNKTI